MKVFITSSFQGNKNKEDIEYLCKLVNQSGFIDFSFIRDIENYEKKFNNSKDLMNKAKEEIKKCDALLIDMTNKPTGRAIEAGIAYSYDKKIITIMKKGTKIKDTTKGISDIIIEYNKIEDIVEPLKLFFNEINED